MHARLARSLVIEHQSFQLASRSRMIAFTQQPLSDVAEENIGTMEPFDQLVIALAAQVKEAGARRVAVADAVKPAALPIDALRIALRVLITVVAIIPVENI